MVWRLIAYMLIILLMIALVFWSCQAIFGKFATTYDSTRQIMATQLDYYEIHLKEHYEQLAAEGISMSENLSDEIEAFLDKKSIPYSEMSDRQTLICQLEDSLCDILLPAVGSADNSGAFFLLDMTANSSLDNAENSRSGVYLRGIGQSHGRSINLYRGSSHLVKSKKIAMHNKWALEFNTTVFPDYDYIRENAVYPPESSYYFTDAVRLPGTWEQVQLLTVPVLGEDGTFYGICGFEVSQNIFKELHSQPSVFEHLSAFTCEAPEDAKNENLRNWNGIQLNTRSGMSSGTTNGYYIDINEQLTAKTIKPSLASRLTFFRSDYFAAHDSAGLLNLEGDSASYVGMCRMIRISPLSDAKVVAVCIPEYDYSRLCTQNNINMAIILVVLLFLGICGCVLASRRFVRPILLSLETMRSKEKDWKKSNITEIDDLMDFLADANRQQDAALASAQDEISSLRRAAAAGGVSASDNSGNSGTAGSAGKGSPFTEPLPDIDPERLQFFLASVDTLSPAERRVFDLYVQGCKASEISEKLCLSINTIKTHNAHIYEKLAVSSRKELLLYIRHMQAQQQTS